MWKDQRNKRKYEEILRRNFIKRKKDPRVDCNTEECWIQNMRKDLLFCDFILLANYGWRSFLRHAIDIEHAEKRLKYGTEGNLEQKIVYPNYLEGFEKVSFIFPANSEYFSNFQKNWLSDQ